MQISVTSRQVQAAKDLLKLDELLGRQSDPAVVLIAKARRVYVLPDGTRLTERVGPSSQERGD